MLIKNISTGVVKNIDPIYAVRLIDSGTYEKQTTEKKVEQQEVKQEQPAFVEKTEKIKVKKGRPSKK